MTDFRLEILTNGFKKISNKKYESFCGHILYDRLRRYNVEMRFQQYVKRPNNKYALIDFCFPLGKGIYYGIEVDEAQHKRTQEVDKIRENQIYQAIENITIRRIDVADTTEEAIFNRCDEIADEIIAKIKELGDDFQPWREMTSDAYKKKGYFNVNECDYINTMKELCEAFNFEPKKAGWFGPKYHQMLPSDKYDNVEIVTLQTGRTDWENNINSDGTEIIEDRISNDKAHKSWVEKIILGNPTISRAVFLKERSNPLGINAYRFIGVFKLDAERTRKENKAYWYKVSDIIKIEQ